MVRRCIRLGLLLFLVTACGGTPAVPEARPLWVWDVGRVLDLAPWDAGQTTAHFHAPDPGVMPGAPSLVGPVVLLDVRASVVGPGIRRVSGRDLARWEAASGEVPQGAIVLVLTGWMPGTTEAAPVLEVGLLDQLCDRFRVRGLATDLPQLEPEARQALAQGGAWWLTGLHFPDELVAGRARLVVAPFPVIGPEWPVRAFLLLPRGMARR